MFARYEWYFTLCPAFVTSCRLLHQRYCLKNQIQFLEHVRLILQKYQLERVPFRYPNQQRVYSVIQILTFFLFSTKSLFNQSTFNHKKKIVDINLQQSNLVGIQFVIWSGRSSWIKNNGANFFVGVSRVTPVTSTAKVIKCDLY